MIRRGSSITMIRCSVIAALLLCALPAYSFTQGTPVTTDSRIKTFVYNENDVYRLMTHYGYQLNIEFGRKEQIQTISVGDRTGWQIIPNGERLFVRAMEDKAHTNMTVVTDKRAYQFDLYSAPPGQNGWDELVYVVRFYYPDDPKGPGGSAMPPMQQSMAAPMQFQMASPMVAPPPVMMAPQMPPPASSMMPPPPIAAAPMAQMPMAPPMMAAPRPIPQQPMRMPPPRPMPQPLPQALPPLGSGGYVASPPPIAAAPMMSPDAYGNSYAAPGVARMRPPSAGVAVLAPSRYGQRGPVPRVPGASPISYDGMGYDYDLGGGYGALAPAAGAVDYLAALMPLAEQNTAAATATGYNYNYSFTGEQSMLPGQMFDDGVHTYLLFPAGKEKPDLFVVTENGKERQVQLSKSDEYLTAPGVYARMTLRHGKQHACIYNEMMTQLTSGHGKGQE